MTLIINKDNLKAIAIGGLILGGGGGGSLEEGIKLGEEALFYQSELKLVDFTDLSEHANVLTISAVGAPSSTEHFVTPKDFVRIVDLFEKLSDDSVDALITNEMGGGSSFNTFIPSALKQLPILDAACNGRAHPLGTMGAMGLSETEGYQTIQTAVGGNKEFGKYLELVVRGTVNTTSSLVRQAAVEAGGLVVVARNMVKKDFIAKNGALGTLKQSCELGAAFLAEDNPEDRVRSVINYLGGEIVCQGTIQNLSLEMSGGLDKGAFEICHGLECFKLFIWNEYMALDRDGRRLGTFPDLLMTFDAVTGMPITSAELSEGQEVFVIQVPFQNLFLGAGMREQSGYQRIEEALGIEIVPYVHELF
ncbi:S-methyl thiohydantoin desulfurase domain-containing protein [Vagococcus elongatus]|uniref:DUF917 domain-containing protein n=1 Tax=Vagococcus elongatus TaxID=180344 RepID=A0A430AHX3_9ENTE|nr:DUF917 family protein [Vagococcus elongatus]RSU07638.1 hypothetical protein CBF29_13280 [Vagococcus elongatus]